MIPQTKQRQYFGEKKMSQTTQQSNLPQHIGLALSGGGYRAAGFHLGLLSYLNRVNLLKQVKMISTVSGGTFTGAKYTLSLVAGQSFQEFYQEYYAFLKNTKLVELALNKLNRKETTTPSLRTDLITASAQVYAETFLQKPNGKPYRFGDILNTKIPLQEVIFNATEFRTGLAFRFQCSANSKAKIGNGNLSIDRSDAAHIRVADIVAASSCFPGGFEPLAFPGDFNWSDSSDSSDSSNSSDSNVFNNVKAAVYKKLSKVDPKQIIFDENPLILDEDLELVESNSSIIEGKEYQDVALMDGGIYDNQGIDSLWLAENRSQVKLDLFIISDVDQRPGSLYSFPEPIKVSKLTLDAIDWLSKILIVFCAFTLVTMGYEFIKDYLSGEFIWLDFFLYIIPILLATATASILLWGRNIIKNRILPLVPQVGIVAWNDLKNLTINQVVNGISLRLSSLQAMAGSVFMQRIRSLSYRFIYQQYEKNERQKLIFNLIYELRTGSQLTQLPGVEPPSPEILKVIDAAANMPTTLWFTEDNQLDNLIISGQVTTCYNLMVYITRSHEGDPSSYPPDTLDLWKILVEDWYKLCSHPQVLSES
jgi:predicted acylesterase/phospholipase RssA